MYIYNKTTDCKLGSRPFCVMSWAMMKERASESATSHKSFIVK